MSTLTFLLFLAEYYCELTGVEAPKSIDILAKYRENNPPSWQKSFYWLKCLEKEVNDKTQDFFLA